MTAHNYVDRYKASLAETNGVHAATTDEKDRAHV